MTAEPNSVAQCGEKGGTGKSSLTNGLAAVAGDRGMRVVVCDVDPRATATDELGVKVGKQTLTLNDLLYMPEEFRHRAGQTRPRRYGMSSSQPARHGLRRSG